MKSTGLRVLGGSWFTVHNGTGAVVAGDVVTLIDAETTGTAL